MALAHVEEDKTVAAYARSDLFERAESSWKRGRTSWPIEAHRQEVFVDEIQRWLEASLAADPSEAGRTIGTRAE